MGARSASVAPWRLRFTQTPCAADPSLLSLTGSEDSPEKSASSHPRLPHVLGASNRREDGSQRMCCRLPLPVQRGCRGPCRSGRRRPGETRANRISGARAGGNPVPQGRSQSLQKERPACMGSEFGQIESGPGFGRGSPVREYWLRRCEGFQAIRADGRPLGRVRRLETRPEGNFLRLRGLRSRAFPLSAVATVWPRASILLIADAEAQEGASRASGDFRVRSGPTPSWEDETIPWWELVHDGGLSAEIPASPRRQAASIFRTASVAGCLSQKLVVVIGRRSKHVAGAAHRRGQNSWEATHARLRTVPSRCRAARASGAILLARGRLALARSLLRLAVWVAGDRQRLLGSLRQPAPPE
jgi:hypothetical protein